MTTASNETAEAAETANSKTATAYGETWEKIISEYVAQLHPTCYDVCMTTNEKLFTIELYRVDEESDSDPMFTAEADNTDDLMAAANTFLNQHVEWNFVRIDESGNVVMELHSYFIPGDPECVAVAIIIYPK